MVPVVEFRPLGRGVVGCYRQQPYYGTLTVDGGLLNVAFFRSARDDCKVENESKRLDRIEKLRLTKSNGFCDQPYIGKQLC